MFATLLQINIEIKFFYYFIGGQNNIGGLSQAIRGTAQLMEQGVGTMSKFQGMFSGK